MVIIESEKCRERERKGRQIGREINKSGRRGREGESRRGLEGRGRER